MEALTHLGIGLFPFQISRLPPATKLRRSLSSSQVTTVCSASRWADRLLSDFNFTTDSSSSSVATATLVTPPLSIDRPERHVPIPIDFYQVLGAETHFLTDGIRRAFEARVSKPPQFGFSDDALRPVRFVNAKFTAASNNYYYDGNQNSRIRSCGRRY